MLGTFITSLSFMSLNICKFKVPGQGFPLEGTEDLHGEYESAADAHLCPEICSAGRG